MSSQFPATIVAVIAFAIVPALPAANSSYLISPKKLTDGVPVQLQGDWRVSLEECPPAVTDRPVWINKTRIRLNHSVGEVRPIRQDDRFNIVLEGDLLSEGDQWKPHLRLELSNPENQLTISEANWKVTLQRCPEKSESVNAPD